jgi:hypothetical protein
MLACVYRNADCVRVLMRLGADCMQLDWLGRGAIVGALLWLLCLSRLVLASGLHRRPASACLNEMFEVAVHSSASSDTIHTIHAPQAGSKTPLLPPLRRPPRSTMQRWSTHQSASARCWPATAAPAPTVPCRVSGFGLVVGWWGGGAWHVVLPAVQ